MKVFCSLVIGVVIFAGLTGVAGARLIRIWTYQELVEKSDVVVMATPVSTNGTKGSFDMPGFPWQPVISIETGFVVSAVLKGDKTLKDFVFHHYRVPEGPNTPRVPNGPSFVSFDPNGKRTYILFLVKEADGRYEPVVGQADPALGVREVVGVRR